MNFETNTDNTIQMELSLSKKKTEAINPYDFKQGVHDFMQCRFDPTGMIPRDYGKFRLHAFRDSFDHWAEGSIWEGIGGDEHGKLYCKKGRFLVECSHDLIRTGRIARSKRETTERQAWEFLYSGAD